MRRKIMSLFLAFLFILSLGSCKNSNINDNPNVDDNHSNEESKDNEDANDTEAETGGNNNNAPSDTEAETGGNNNNAPSDTEAETGGNNNISNGSAIGALDKGNGEVISTGDVAITSCSGLNEAAYVEFDKITNESEYDVYIKQLI